MSEDRRPVWPIAVVALMAILPFLPAVRGEFVTDDLRFVADNVALTEPDIVERAFTDATVVSANREGADWQGIYRPLRTLDFAIDRRIAGDRTWVYHAHSILWHALAAVLVFWLLRILLGSGWAPLMGAAVFAVHPAQVESVAWISARSDVMSGALAILTVVLALRGTRVSLVLAPIVFAAALFAKESAIVAPVLVVILLAVRRPKADRVRWLATICPLVVLAVAYWVLRSHVLAAAGDMQIGHRAAWWGGSWFGALLTMGRGAVHYAQVLLFPGNLMLDYHVPQPAAGEAPADAVLLAAGVLVLLSLAIRSWRRGGAGGTGLLWLFVALAPACNLLVTISIPTADRFLYLPMVGFALLAAVSVRMLTVSPLGRLVPAAALVVVLCLGALATDRAAVWTTEKGLWTATLHDPESGLDRGTVTSFRAPYHLAYLDLLAAEKLLDEPEVAGARLMKARRLARTACEAANRYGGYMDDASWILGTHLLARIEYALARLRGGEQWTTALLAAERGMLTAGSEYAPSHSIMGKVCLHLGLLDRARAAFTAALAIAPGEESHRRNLAATLVLQARRLLRGGERAADARVLVLIKDSLDLDGGLATNGAAHRLAGESADRYGRRLEAALAAVKESEDEAEAQFELARVHATFGRTDLAGPILNHLLEARPNDPRLVVDGTVLLHQYRGDAVGCRRSLETYGLLLRLGKLPPDGFLEIARCHLRLARIAMDQGRAADVHGIVIPAIALLGRSPLKPSFAGLEVQGSLLRELALADEALGVEAEESWRKTAEAFARALEREEAAKPALGALARALQGRGEALESLGDASGARADYERYLAIHGSMPPMDAPFIALAIERLAGADER